MIDRDVIDRDVSVLDNTCRHGCYSIPDKRQAAPCRGVRHSYTTPSALRVESTPHQEEHGFLRVGPGVPSVHERKFKVLSLVLSPPQEEMYIFMEYCDEGTLEEVSRLGLQEHVIRLYSKQITVAINVLHEHGIVHRDIKGTPHHKSSCGCT